MSVTWPKISLITENLNHGEFLEAMIRSAISQDYPNLEYIVMDGGSTDNSVEIIRKYESRIAYWCSEKDDGLFDACNKGFARSTGEVMAFVGSDDMLLPGSLHAVAGIMAQFPQIEWLTTLQPGAWDYQGTLSPTAPVAGFSREAFLEGYYAPRPDAERGFYHEFGWIQSEATFWRRSLWKKAGGRFRTEHFRYAAEFDLWARFFMHAELYATPYMLAGWRRRAGQTASRGNHYATESARSLAEHRQASTHRCNRLRQAVLRRGLHRIPLLRRAIRQTIGYRGNRVVRRTPNEAEGSWELQEYRFI